MRGDELVKLVAAHSLFGGASALELDVIGARATQHSYARGETFIHQGDPGDSLYILLTGVARVSLMAVNGREITLDFLEAGAVVGEMAVLDGAERSASVIAVEPVTVLRLDRRDIREIAAARPEFAWQLLGQMAKRLRQANATIEGDRAFGSGPRLARCLMRLLASGSDSAKLRLDLNQTDLAQFAGMSREQINRQLAVWDDTGLIAREQGRVRVLDSEALAEIAEFGE
jgi:CRP/FNR family transcriptional regulator, cyclic AMP receptor protein